MKVSVVDLDVDREAARNLARKIAIDDPNLRLAASKMIVGESSIVSYLHAIHLASFEILNQIMLMLPDDFNRMVQKIAEETKNDVVKICLAVAQNSSDEDVPLMPILIGLTLGLHRAMNPLIYGAMEHRAVIDEALSMILVNAGYSDEFLREVGLLKEKSGESENE